MNYLPRIADSLLADKLEAKGCVLIRGPKWCGKTTTAEQKANSVIYIGDPAHREEYMQMGAIDPGQLLLGGTPHLVDE